jgi:hypothetical protein
VCCDDECVLTEVLAEDVGLGTIGLSEKRSHAVGVVVGGCKVLRNEVSLTGNLEDYKRKKK